MTIPNNIYPDFLSYKEILTEECAMALGWIFMAHIGKYSSLKAEFRLIQIKVDYNEVTCSSGVIKDQSGNSTILETKEDSESSQVCDFGLGVDEYISPPKKTRKIANFM